jgi:hypothetical protein
MKLVCLIEKSHHWPEMPEAATKCKMGVHSVYKPFLWRVFACHFDFYLFCMSRKESLAEVALAADSRICCELIEME